MKVLALAPSRRSPAAQGRGPCRPPVHLQAKGLADVSPHPRLQPRLGHSSYTHVIYCVQTMLPR